MKRLEARLLLLRLRGTPFHLCAEAPPEAHIFLPKAPEALIVGPDSAQAEEAGACRTHHVAAVRAWNTSATRTHALALHPFLFPLLTQSE